VTKIPDEKLLELGEMVRREAHGSGFCLIAFEFTQNPCRITYCSNADAASLANALRQAADQIDRELYGHSPAQVARRN